MNSSVSVRSPTRTSSTRCVDRLLVSRKKSGTGSIPAGHSFGKSDGASKAPHGARGRAVHGPLLTRQRCDAAALQPLVLSSPRCHAATARVLSELLLSAGQCG